MPPVRAARVRSMKMSQVRAELRRVRRVLQTPDLSPSAVDEAYGAQQALCWVLGQNAMAPSRSAKLSGKRGRK